MQALDGTFVYSATDLNNYLECKHLVALSRDVAENLLVKPDVKDPTAELVARKGDEHEHKWLDRYRERYGDTNVVRFDERPDRSIAALRAAEAATVAAMASGVAIIYQGTFFDGEFLGYTDFLRRVERPSAHWPWSYEVIDTKLALSPKPYFLIQLCNYSEHLARVQGVAPNRGYVVFGNDEERSFRIDDYAAYYRHLKASFLAAMPTTKTTYPLEVEHCDVCVWRLACERRRECDDHLSLVAGIRRDQIAKIEKSGITTMTGLAAATERPERMREPTFDVLRTQAELQVEQRRAIVAGDAYPYRYRFHEPGPNAKPESVGVIGTRPETAPTPGDEVQIEAATSRDGLAKLPEPAPGDIFFDIEGDPLYRADRGLEYLFGLYIPDEDRYIAFWAKDPSEERQAFEACVDFITDRRQRYSDLHVYHYASYERSALGRLMGVFASRENEVDDFFRTGLFVDLYPVVRQAMWISQPSYSLKKVEAFYGWRRRTQTRGGDDSIVMFEMWRATEDQAILDDIERYNEDDCRSTHGLRDWLLRVRDDYNATHADQMPWRPVRTGTEAPQAVERTELESRLLDAIEPPQTYGDLRSMGDDLRERWLLGNLLQYHRRENKPSYWEYFQRTENVGDLAEFDRKAIGGMRRRHDIAPRKHGQRDKNLTYAFTYPAQEHDLGKTAHCADTAEAVTDIVSHDEAERIIEVKIRAETVDRLTALIPGPPISHGKRQAGVERIARALLEERLTIDHPATSALLRRDAPRLAGRLPGFDIQPAALDAGAIADTIGALDDSYLVIQGPPGSGKSTYGAAAIVQLLRAGKRVGLMANSHKALHNLLHKIERCAFDRSVRFRGVHKESETESSDFASRLEVPMVQSLSKVSPRDWDLVSGTSYFWPGDDCTASVDTIVIDEAGQVSLADALNAAMAARNVVLLGDPQQLPQVSQGSHPIGADRSVLQHLLDGRDTVPPNRGIFLDVTYRMQPELARFVSDTSYESRLSAASSTEKNRIDSRGLTGGGIVYLPIEHDDNSRSSKEEAARVVEEIRVLLAGGTFIRNRDVPQLIREDDILVVAPYNAQRRKIRALLADAGFDRVNVGTVDKFQGQEAPVVFYSMATSSDDDLPRDMTFLFDRNRFNVAISRAQCLSVLVCSPRLLDARCRNPEQMQLVNLLCAFAEKATTYDNPRLPLVAATG